MDVERIKLLLEQRQAIDTELKEIVNNGTAKKERKPQACSVCGETSHSARTCPKKPE